MRVWAGILATLLGLACCARPTPPPKAALPADVTTTRMYVGFTLTLHADVEFTETRKQQLLEAAERLRLFTNDRARLTIVFDVDFSTVSGLKRHHDLDHSIILGVKAGGTIANTIDARHPGNFRVLAETCEMRNNSFHVTFIEDRIDPEDFMALAMHEFGHVIGFDDLPVHGAVMSWSEVRGVRAPREFMPADEEHCRSKGFCD